MIFVPNSGTSDDAGTSDAPATLVAGAVEILNTASPAAKVSKTHQLAEQWRSGSLQITDGATISPPERPARPAHPALLPPREVPKRGPGGKGRRALLHALCHIELNAIDLAWDLIARFADELSQRLSARTFSAFCDDWVGVADDEARHFTMLVARISVLQTAYGDLPAHDGLWSAAFDTRRDILARLAVVPLVLEARGLDVTPGTIKRLRAQDLGDDADTLEAIYRDELVHVGAGIKWFNILADDAGLARVETYRSLVRRYFKGRVRPPFNISGRSQANFSRDYYENIDNEQT